MTALDRFVTERLPALRSADFRRFWLAQIVSVIGSQMQFAAVHWQVYEKTGDPAALGLVGLMRVAPILVFSLLGGAFADAVDRRRLMLLTQSVMIAVAATLGFLTVEGYATIGWIYALTAVGAAAVAFDNPARQSLVPSLVPDKDVPNAAALSSTGFNVATIAGPVFAGLTIKYAGAGYAYFLNALSFVAVIAALLMMRPPARRTEPVNATDTADAKPNTRITLETFREAYRFIRATPILGATMLVDFLATFFSSASALLPVYAKDILHVGPDGYGWLSAFPAVGSLLAGSVMSLAPQPRNTGRVILYAVIAYGLATVGFGFSTTFAAAAFFLAGTGAADTVSTVLRLTIRNLVTPDRLRGRVVAASMIFFMGGPQLGELEAGVLARYTSAVFSVVSGGIACIVSVLAVAASMPVLLRFRMSEHLAGAQQGDADGNTTVGGDDAPAAKPDRNT